MSGPKIDYNKIRDEEEKAGKVAAKMIQTRVHSLLLEYGLDDTGGLKKSIKSEEKMGDLRLFGIITRMQRHGYILQQGVNTKRTSHEKKLRKRGGKYSVREHTMMLQQKPFITEGLEDSGAFEYLVDALGKIRMEEVILSFKGTNIIVK
ncbi:hypothetical protein HCG49_17095 [Arenibacter sp. 6A1]|uniref:hypothetical protein n=1 Tax=Arenibacter sp. 6A1 TaxID=2720391 RepID=UPI001444F886|nr:hypothetical protein [Arenibacter sp. 6A1]NKI28273.1 hypothetical protein [Arenibacter sp. 6A1]